MKTPVLYRFVLVSFVMALPLLTFGNKSNRAFAQKWDDNALFAAPLQEQPPRDDKRPERDRGKPDVKEVPKSRRMPKPKAVVDRVKQTRPPVRVVRPRGLKRNLGVF